MSDNNQPQEQEQVQNTEDSAVVAPAQEVSLTQDTPPPVTMTAKQLTKYKKFMRKQVSAYKRYMEQQRHKKDKETRLLRRLKEAVGGEHLAALVSKHTTVTPETKDESGNVTQKETKALDIRAVEQGCRDLIVINRENRILSGKRKRSTGRGSDRASHSNRVKYLIEQSLRSEATTFETESVQTSDLAPTGE
jgi:hypothetical protein